MENHKKYKIYDLYEGKEAIGCANDMNEMQKIAREWFEDTDGECALVYAKFNSELKGYDFSGYYPLDLR